MKWLISQWLAIIFLPGPPKWNQQNQNNYKSLKKRLCTIIPSWAFSSLGFVLEALKTMCFFHYQVHFSESTFTFARIKWLVTRIMIVMPTNRHWKLSFGSSMMKFGIRRTETWALVLSSTDLGKGNLRITQLPNW